MESAEPLKDNPRFGCHPPRPQLTLRIGISGHRPKLAKLPPRSFVFVQKRLRDVFACVDAELAGIMMKQRDLFSHAPAVRLVSGLAAGADQIAVGAMPEEWALDAVLPFPTEEYVKDFGAQSLNDEGSAIAAFRACLERPLTTVTELPLEVPSAHAASEADEPQRQDDGARDAAYARLGGFLLRQIDVLVVVWDGRREDGKGGTAEVMRAAVAAEIPTVWVHSLNDTFARMIEGVDDDGLVLAPAADCCKGPLREAIEAIVDFPANGAEELPDADVADAHDRLHAYGIEEWPSPSRSVIYDAFKRGVVGKLPRLQLISEEADSYRMRWAPPLGDDPGAGQLRDRLEKLLLPRYAWSDALAVAYSHRYRSAYIFCYLLATAAVAIALCGIFVHEYWPHDLKAKIALVSAELLVILTIVYVVRSGRRARWKEKWMEYRSLAELLFNARFLSYLAEHGTVHRNGVLNASSPTWLLWYLRATIRELGLPPVRLDGTYQRAVLGVLDKYVVLPQCTWHRDNARALERMHGILHRIGDSCFTATALLLGVFLAAWLFAWVSAHLIGNQILAESIDGWLEHCAIYLTFLAAGLPAFGAAVASIRETGDFEKVAERSRKTALALSHLSQDIVDARRTLTLAETGDTLLTAAQVLSEDLASWQSVYGHKRLELPA